MGQDLKAENLTISIPYLGCDKNCPYCISRMTGYIRSDPDHMIRNISKVKKIADSADIFSVLITGKGEPLLNIGMLNIFIEAFRDWPLELQTNGLWLTKRPWALDNLKKYGLDVIAISIDNLAQLEKTSKVFEHAKSLNMVTRATINLSDMITEELLNNSLENFINKCKTLSIDQLTFRRLTIPEKSMSPVTEAWIKKHAADHMWENLVNQCNELLNKKGRLIRTLNHGITVWDINGISLAWSDYCIQERDEGNNIRSLIFQEDGHLYTSWGSSASILF